MIGNSSNTYRDVSANRNSYNLKRPLAIDHLVEEALRSPTFEINEHQSSSIEAPQVRGSISKFHHIYSLSADIINESRLKRHGLRMLLNKGGGFI